MLLTGVAGQTSFGQAAFVGLGAYTSAYLTTKYGTSPWLALLVGLALTAIVSLALGFITLRMKGHYLPLATIAWGISLYYLFGNLEMLGGHTGMTGIPALAIGGIELRNERYYYFLIWAIALAALWSTNNLLDSRPGRAIARCAGARYGGAFGVNSGGSRSRLRVRRAARVHLRLALRASQRFFIRRRSGSTRDRILFWRSSRCRQRVGASSGYAAHGLKQWLQRAARDTLRRDGIELVLPAVSRLGNFDPRCRVLMVLRLQRAREASGPWLAPSCRSGPPPVATQSRCLRVASSAMSVARLRNVRPVRRARAVNDLQFVSFGEIMFLIARTAPAEHELNLISACCRDLVTFRPVATDCRRPPYQIAARGIAALQPWLIAETVLDNGARGVLRA